MSNNEQSSDDYKLKLAAFSERDQANSTTGAKPYNPNEESVLTKCERLGKEKRWVELTQSDVCHWFYSKAGNLVTIKEFIKEEVDNARFTAGKVPFFGSKYLWSKEDTFPWVDRVTGQPQKKCPNGVGNDEIFNAMVENNEVDKYLSKEDYSEKMAEEYETLEKKGFVESTIF